MTGRIGLAARVVAQAPPSWIAYRVWYAAQQRLGWFHWRTPARPWRDRPLAWWVRGPAPDDPRARPGFLGRFLFDVPPLASAVGAGAPAAADALLDGRWPMFSGPEATLGWPPDWLLDAATGRRGAATAHWSRLDEYAAGDIKYVWEASRFSAAYTLVRAWRRSGEARYAGAFWDLVDDWMRANPPMLGPNWRCGQEAAFRVMAWCFGLFALRATAAATPARVSQLVAALAWHADRIEANLAYARSQVNNHAISEAVGLWTVGVLVPGLAAAERWRTRGAELLAEEIARQIDDDGAYVQHSVNYHRLALHDLLWALRLGEVNERPLPPVVAARTRLALDWLSRIVDPSTGRAPNYGPNDGALVLPLTDCDYADFRPTIQAGARVLAGAPALPPGPWDELGAWLFGDVPTASGPAAAPSRAPLAGGYQTLAGPESWVLVRCGRYRQRPAHADQLHVDLWWRGRNIAIDPGTYRYNAPDGWSNALSATRVHNTLTIDDRDQMTRAGRFLWLDWAQAIVTRRETLAGGVECLEALHDGYRGAGVVHRRAVLRDGDRWVIVDDAAGAAGHRARLHWLLCDVPHAWDAAGGRLTLETDAGTFVVQLLGGTGDRTLVRGGAADDRTRGWWSPTYGVKRPALSVAATAATPARFVTIFAPGPPQACRLDGDTVEVGGGERAWRIVLGRSGTGPLIDGVERGAAATGHR